MGRALGGLDCYLLDVAPAIVLAFAGETGEAMASLVSVTSGCRPRRSSCEQPVQGQHNQQQEAIKWRNTLLQVRRSEVLIGLPMRTVRSSIARGRLARLHAATGNTASILRANTIILTHWLGRLRARPPLHRSKFSLLATGLATLYGLLLTRVDSHENADPSSPRWFPLVVNLTPGSGGRCALVNRN